MIDWNDERLRDWVRAMRCLPPGAKLPTFQHNGKQALFHDLMALGPETDPIGWLEQSRSNEIVRMLAWNCLVTFIEAMPWEASALTGSKQFRFNEDNLPVLSEAQIEALVARLKGTDSTSVTAEALQETFYSIQGLMYRFAPQQAIDNRYWNLMFELLRLPINTDLLQYMLTEYRHLAAVEALSELWAELLNGLEVSSLLSQSEPVHKAVPNLRVHLNQVRITLRQIVLMDTGFKLTLNMRVPRKLVPPTAKFVHTEWEGVESLTDNFGHCYLILFRLPRGKGLSWRVEQTVDLYCYPALQPSVTDITLSSRHTTVFLKGVVSQVWGDETIGEIPLGDAQWLVKRPRKKPWLAVG
jgi:hypothetical protein